MLESGNRSQVEYRVLHRDGRVVGCATRAARPRRARGARLHAGPHARRTAKRSQSLAAAQAELLEFIATGAALPQVLDGIARFVEGHAEDPLLASILLMDRDGVHLRHGAGPSLPDFWNENVDGIVIGPRAGSCGSAAFRRERVFVSDIATDPLWEGIREMACARVAARLLVDAVLRHRRLAARYLRPVLPRAPCVCRR